MIIAAPLDSGRNSDEKHKLVASKTHADKVHRTSCTQDNLIDAGLPSPQEVDESEPTQPKILDEEVAAPQVQHN